MASGLSKSALLPAIGALAMLAGAVNAAATGSSDGDAKSMPALVVDRGTFCFATGSDAALHAGKMRLETPHADVAVLGTRFILEVNETYTRVTVLEGKVEVTRHGGGVVTPVEPGQAATATATDVQVRAGTNEIPKQLPPGNCG